ncbi:MAG: diguanylate cyclase [Candidatus Izemoplasma sp.]|nr:diguanylate cyclase [Candidatus Izemoplasma sp.]
MTLYIWIIFIILSIMALVPLTHYDLFNVDPRYKYFKYLSLLLFLWSAILAVRNFLVNGTLLYYLTVSIYPLVYLICIIFLYSIVTYMKKKIPMVIHVLLWTFLSIDLVIAYTNQYHQLMLKSLPSSDFRYIDYRQATNGAFFHIHTAASYTLILITGYFIVKSLYKNLRSNKDYVPFLFIVTGIILGISLNIIHIFVYTFTLDPTYIVFIFFISLLYYVFYMRDLKLILGVDRNHFILDNLREKYVIVNDKNIVVDASKAFKRLFDIKVDEELRFDSLLKTIQDYAIIYEDANELDDLNFNDDKLYFNMHSKDIHLPFYKYSGKFYLFYDDTANQKYIHGIQYIKTHDLMTRLFNRNYLEEIRDDLDNSNQHYHIILFDLDGLKLFNDYLGHEAGDKLLQRFANQLLDLSNKDDIIPIRLGGDEFLLIIINRDIKTVKHLITLLDQQNQDKPILDIIQYSYGLGTNKNSDKTMDQVLSEADENMYSRKSDKGNYKDKLIKALKDKANTQ